MLRKTMKKRHGSLCVGLSRKKCYLKRGKNCTMTRGVIRKSHCRIIRKYNKTPIKTPIKTMKKRHGSRCVGLSRKKCYLKKGKKCRMTNGIIRKSHCRVTRNKK